MKLIGTGIFMWYGSERQTDRYGAFYLASESYSGLKPGRKVKIDLGAVSTLVGKRVRIVAKVVENRPSEHIGDAFHNLSPNPLDVGQELELAVGRLGTHRENGETFLEVHPDDNRREFWIDPRKFFQLHDQTIELYVEVSDTAPAHPVFKSAGVSGDEVISNGDGTCQTKTKQPYSRFSVPADIQPMGDGMFSVTQPNMKAGARHRMTRN